MSSYISPSMAKTETESGEQAEPLREKDIYDTLLEWAKDRGIEWYGVAPRRMPGRGIGMVATRPLKVPPPASVPLPNLPG